MKACAKSIVIHTALQYVLQINIRPVLDCSACFMYQSLERNTGDISNTYRDVMKQDSVFFLDSLWPWIGRNETEAKLPASFFTFPFLNASHPKKKKKKSATPKYRFKTYKPLTNQSDLRGKYLDRWYRARRDSHLTQCGFDRDRGGVVLSFFHVSEDSF